MSLVPLEQALPEARAAAASFLGGLAPSGRLVVLCHFDADGLAAGAVLGRGLRRMGFEDVAVVHSERGESAFSEGARARLAALGPAGLVVTDLGVNRAGVLPEVPTLYVDHHRPEGEPPGGNVVSGYGWEPIPTSAWLAYELVEPLAAVDDLVWIAAVGAMSDLGDNAPWARLPEIKRRHAAKWLKEAVALVNAARRSSVFDVGTALDLLMTADDPRVFGDETDPRVARLKAYRAEVKAALDEARRAAPLFAAGQPFALLKLHSPCQIHPLIAQQWRGRLPAYAVIAANTGYLPGLVAFSVRSARADLDLPARLRAVDLGEHNESFGHGHDQASGGHLPPGAFNRLLAGLGFDERAHVTL